MWTVFHVFYGQTDLRRWIYLNPCCYYRKLCDCSPKVPVSFWYTGPPVFATSPCLVPSSLLTSLTVLATRQRCSSRGAQSDIKIIKQYCLICRRRYIKPVRLSNRDRAYITYMIVCHQPFGIRDKYYGLFRYLYRNNSLIIHIPHKWFVRTDSSNCVGVNLKGRVLPPLNMVNFYLSRIAKRNWQFLINIANQTLPAKLKREDFAGSAILNKWERIGSWRSNRNRCIFYLRSLRQQELFMQISSPHFFPRNICFYICVTSIWTYTTDQLIFNFRYP